MGGVQAHLPSCPRCNDGPQCANAAAAGEEIFAGDEDSTTDDEDQQGRLSKPLFKVEALMETNPGEHEHRSGSKTAKSLAAVPERPLHGHFLSQAYRDGFDLGDQLPGAAGYVLEQQKQGQTCPGWQAYRHRATGILVAAEALHLAPFGASDLEVVFHYTSERPFRSVCSSAKVSGEAWQSLGFEGLVRGGSGGQVHVLGAEPAELAREPIFMKLWPDEHRFCLPIVLPRPWLKTGPKEASLPVGDLEKAARLGVSAVRCPAEMRALECAASCGLQRRRAAVDGCRRRWGGDHPCTLGALSSLAAALDAMGADGEAEQCYREALEGYEQHLGLSHPPALAVASGLARLLHSQGDLESAEALFRRVLACNEERLGPFHPETLSAGGELASLLIEQGNVAEAEPLLRQSLEKREATAGLTHPATLLCVRDLADVLEAEGRLAEAEAMQRRAVDAARAALGATHPDALLALSRLARLLVAQGKFREAEPLFRRAWQLTREKLGDWHPTSLLREDSLAAVFVSRGELGRAVDAYRRLLEGKEVALGLDHPETLATACTLAELLEAQGNCEEAMELYMRVQEGRGSTLGPEHPSTRAVVASLVRTVRRAWPMASVHCVLRGHVLERGAGWTDSGKIVDIIACFLGIDNPASSDLADAELLAQWQGWAQGLDPAEGICYI